MTEALDAAIESHALTAVVAPAGYGKTSALTAALDAQSRPVVRYTAQLWHAGEFAEALVTAMRGVRDDFGRVTLALARRRSGAPGAASEGQRLGAAFADELDHLPTPLVVLFEDVHLLGDDPYFAEFLTGLMRTVPSHVRLVLEGRFVPAGIRLADWLAHERAAVLGADDPRFGAAEIVRLAERAGRPVDAATAETLQRRFDGWAAGLTLHLAARSGADPSADARAEIPIASLLDGAVTALPPELARFLEETVVYETLDRSVLECDGGIGDAAAAFLEALERSGTMLTIERPLERYRLHPLLRETLQTRLRRRCGPAALPERHLAAAGALEGLDRRAAALYHVEQSGSAASLAAFLRRNAVPLFAGGLGERAATSARGLGAAPSAVATSALIAGMLARQRGLPGAAAAFERAETAARAAGKGDQAVLAATLRIEDGIARGVPVTAKELSVLASAAPSDPGAAVNTATFAGWSAAIRHDLPAARRFAREAVAAAGDRLLLRLRPLSLSAYAATATGAFAAAAGMLDDALRALEGSDHIVLLTNTLTWYARLALFWGDTVAARDYATQGRELAARLGLSAELAGLDLALGEIAARDGDPVAAARAVASVRALGDAAWYAVDRDRSEAMGARFVARALFARDGAAVALASVRAALRDPAVTPDRHLPLLADAALYGVLAGDAAPPELAAATALPAPRIADALDAADVISADRLLRLARAALGQGAAARTAVPPAIESAYAGLVAARPAFDLLRDPVALLADAERGAAALAADGAAFEARILRALRPTSVRGGAAAPAVKHGALTPREHEILGLVAQGLTNKEIAQRCTLSPRTVDTHVERILSKLGVTTRTRAVAAALRAGLVAGTP